MEKIRRAALLGLTLVLLFAGAVTLFALRAQRQLTSAHRSVVHTYEVKQSVDDLLSAIVDVEVGELGFLSGGAEASARQIRTGEDRASEAVRSLCFLVADNPRQLMRMFTIARLSTERRTALEDVRSRLAREGRNVAEEYVRGGAGQQLLRELREAVAELDREEDRLLAVRIEAERSAALSTGIWISVACGSLAVVVLLAGKLLLRYLRERERAEQAAAETAALLRTTLDSVTQGIVVYDAQHRMILWNERFAQLKRLPPSLAHVGTSYAALIEDTERSLGSPIGGPTREIAATGRFVPYKVGFRWPDGPAVEVQASGMPGGGFVVTWSDVTERDRVERMKDEFVSTVSHELRTPLTSIMGSLSLMANGMLGPLPAGAREFIDIALRNGDRLVRLVNDILDMEKIESGKLEFELSRQPLGPLVRAALAEVRGFADGLGVRIVFTDEAPEAAAHVDADRFAQLLVNLVSNAAKFSPPEAAVQVRLARVGSALRVSVADRGPGVPAEFRGRIFEKFAQADGSDRRERGGTGLGLSIARAIVERMAGSIAFESEPGRGATFWFDLPDADQRARRNPMFE